MSGYSVHRGFSGCDSPAANTPITYKMYDVVEFFLGAFVSTLA